MKRFYHNPAFYDIFGVFIFVFIIVISVLMLNSNEKLPNYLTWILLIIGILGLIVDLFSVYKEYFGK